MKYSDRAAQNSLVDQAVYFNARNTNPSPNTTGTPMGFDATTGRTLIVAGDGIVRTNSIANSTQLTIASPFVGGNGGNAGFSDGRGA